MNITDPPLPSVCTRGHRIAWHADGRGFDVCDRGEVLTTVQYPKPQDWQKVRWCPWCGSPVMVEQ